MKNFEYLSKSEIEKSLKKYRNPYVKDTFKKVINNPNLKINRDKDNNRIEAFERILGNARTLTRRIVASGRFSKKEKYELDYGFSDFMTMLVKENTFFKSSVLDNFINSEGKNIIERFKNTEIENYFDRTIEFRSKYGNEILTYKGETKTLNEFFNDFNDKKIDKDTMDFIIYEFKDVNEEWISNPHDYKANNYESNEATLADYGFSK